MFITLTLEQLFKKFYSDKLVTCNHQLKNQRVKAKAQLGEDELNPKESFVEDELHLATIPLVGRFVNSSLFIH